jgi:hypothetical protein
MAKIQTQKMLTIISQTTMGPIKDEINALEMLCVRHTLRYMINAVSENGENFLRVRLKSI